MEQVVGVLKIGTGRCCSLITVADDSTCFSVQLFCRPKEKIIKKKKLKEKNYPSLNWRARRQWYGLSLKKDGRGTCLSQAACASLELVLRLLNGPWCAELNTVMRS